jgi:hypothetical protein
MCAYSGAHGGLVARTPGPETTTPLGVEAAESLAEASLFAESALLDVPQLVASRASADAIRTAASFGIGLCRVRMDHET